MSAKREGGVNIRELSDCIFPHCSAFRQAAPTAFLFRQMLPARYWPFGHGTGLLVVEALVLVLVVLDVLVVAPNDVVVVA
jgi:hypothetical protein